MESEKENINELSKKEENLTAEEIKVTTYIIYFPFRSKES